MVGVFIIYMREYPQTSVCGHSLFIIRNEFFHSSAERAQGQFGDFEVLLSKRYSNDGYAEQQSKQKVDERQFPAGKQKPNDVHKKSPAFRITDNLLAKGIQGDAGHFEALEPDRNANDGEAPHAAYQEPVEGTEETPENDP